MIISQQYAVYRGAKDMTLGYRYTIIILNL